MGLSKCLDIIAQIFLFVNSFFVFHKYFCWNPVSSPIPFFTRERKCDIIVSYPLNRQPQGDTDMKLIYQYEYRKGGPQQALDSLHALADSGADAILCRIRCSSDNVLFVHQDTTLSELCSCDEYVSDLRYCEIDALMRLCLYHVLTLDQLLENYRGTTPLILHFRSVRPDAGTVSRIMRDSRFSLATDSPEQLRIIAQAFPGQHTIGFACHYPTALQMAQSGAFAVCLYGRDVSGFASMDLAALTEHCPVWAEPPRFTEAEPEAVLLQAEAMGFERVILPYTSIQ